MQSQQRCQSRQQHRCHHFLWLPPEGRDHGDRTQSRCTLLSGQYRTSEKYKLGKPIKSSFSKEIAKTQNEEDCICFFHPPAQQEILNSSSAQLYNLFYRALTQGLQAELTQLRPEMLGLELEDVKEELTQIFPSLYGRNCLERCWSSARAVPLEIMLVLWISLCCPLLSPLYPNDQPAQVSFTSPLTPYCSTYWWTSKGFRGWEMLFQEVSYWKEATHPPLSHFTYPNDHIPQD